LLARARAECAAVSNPTEGMPHDAAVRGMTDYGGATAPRWPRCSSGVSSAPSWHIRR